MNYARTRLLEATGPKTSGEGTKVRLQTYWQYRAIHEAAVARKALLEAQLKAKRTVARLSEDKTECDREHQPIAEEIVAVQNELRLSVDSDAEGQHMQVAEMNAMGHGIIGMKELLIQRELLMESQLQEMCSQIETMKL